MAAPACGQQGGGCAPELAGLLASSRGEEKLNRMLRYGFHLQLYVAIAAGAVAAAMLVTAAHYQWARWCEASPAADIPAA